MALPHSGCHSGARGARALMCNCTSENPYSRWWLWIPGLRLAAHPGMTGLKLLRDPGQHREQRRTVAGPEQLVQPRLVLGRDQLLRPRQHGAALVGKNQDVRAAIVGGAD